jgi:hypothetical protein
MLDYREKVKDIVENVAVKVLREIDSTTVYGEEYS